MIIDSSRVHSISLSDIARAVHPCDLVYQFVRFVSEGNWNDVQVFESFILWVHNEFLRLNSHEFWIHPRSEKFSVWRCEPWVLVILHSFLQLHLHAIWLDLSQTKELLIDIFKGVCMRTSKII